MSLIDFITKKPTLRTENLILREMVESDVPALLEWTPDLSIYKYWGKRPGKSDLNPELLFRTKTKPTKSFLWGIENGGKIVGQFWVYLIENDRIAQIAYRLSPKVQGKGYMLEALRAVTNFCFTQTELQRLWTCVHVENHASYKTLEHMGFTREGHIRSGKMGNTYCDYFIYGLLKSDLV